MEALPENERANLAAYMVYNVGNSSEYSRLHKPQDYRHRPAELVDHGVRYQSNLDLEDSAITSLPENLNVWGSLRLKGNKGITKLPDNLTVGYNLDLRETNIKEFPKNLWVGHNIYVPAGFRFESPPVNTRLGGDIIDSSYGRIYSPYTSGGVASGRALLTDNLTFLESLGIDDRHGPITELPNGITVQGSLEITQSAIKKLPENLSIGYNIFVPPDFDVTSIPQSLKLGGSIIDSSTPRRILYPVEIELTNVEPANVPAVPEQENGDDTLQNSSQLEARQAEITPRTRFEHRFWKSKFGEDVRNLFGTDTQALEHLENCVKVLSDALGDGYHASFWNVRSHVVNDIMMLLASYPSEDRAVVATHAVSGLITRDNYYLNSDSSSQRSNMERSKASDKHFRGHLSLTNVSISRLPEKLTVWGDLNLDGASIGTMPEQLVVKGDLNLSNSRIPDLPDSLFVGGNLDLRKTGIKQLPAKLKVNGDLILPEGFPSQSLLGSMEVGGRIIDSEGRQFPLLNPHREVSAEAANDTPALTDGARQEGKQPKIGRE